MSEPEHKSITGELTEQEVEAVDTVLDEEAPYTAFRAREHRERVIREFLDHPNVPAKREEGAPYRTPEKARLDFAFQKAAERASRCESTVRAGTLKHYEGDYQTKRFRKDLQQIEQRVLSK
jgi:hypothetical protein